MRVRPSNKNDLLGVVGGQIDGRVNSITIDPMTWLPDANDEFHLVWPDRSDSNLLPSAVVMDPKAQREFLAWTSTFLSGLRPFTAHIRVMDLASLRLVQALQSRPSLQQLASPVLALVLAENLMAAESGASGSYAACRSTYSYAAGRSLALAAPSEYQGLLVEGWTRLLRMLPASRSIPDFESLLLVWSILSHLADDSTEKVRNATPEGTSAIVSACEQMLKTGAVSASAWSRLCVSPRLADAAEKMSGPREDRVLYFDQFIMALRESKEAAPIERAFASGYLASRVAVGSLEHFGLARSHASVFPGIQYWYALCAGLHPQSEVPHQSRGLGFRLFRDLQDQAAWDSAPRADISLAELEMLRGADNYEEFWTSAPGVIEVEIMPLVSTIIRTPAARGTSQQQELLRADGQEDIEAMRRLGEAIDQAQFYYRRIAGPGSRPQQERLDKRGRR